MDTGHATDPSQLELPRVRRHPALEAEELVTLHVAPCLGLRLRCTTGNINRTCQVSICLTCTKPVDGCVVTADC